MFKELKMKNETKYNSIPSVTFLLVFYLFLNVIIVEYAYFSFLRESTLFKGYSEGIALCARIGARAASSASYVERAGP